MGTEGWTVYLPTQSGDLPMSCPVNALGRSSCQIIDYPDSPGHSFCAVCQRRFIQPSVNARLQLPQQSNHEFGFLSILGGVCLALIMVSIVTEQSTDAPNAPDTPQPEVSQRSYSHNRRNSLTK